MHNSCTICTVSRISLPLIPVTIHNDCVSLSSDCRVLIIPSSAPMENRLPAKPSGIKYVNSELEPGNIKKQNI